MNICLISDTHGEVSWTRIPHADVLIHSGDSCGIGAMNEVRSFARWMKNFTHQIKIYVPGNHDRPFDDQRRESAIAEMEEAGVHVLIDESMFIECEGGANLKVYGMPWTPEFGQWAFMKRRNKPIREKVDLIPDDVDILVTHGPPYGVLDEPRMGHHVGCEELNDAYRSGRINPSLHVFGHIHGGYGTMVRGRTKFCNVSLLDELYKNTNSPMIHQIDEDLLENEV